MGGPTTNKRRAQAEKDNSPSNGSSLASRDPTQRSAPKSINRLGRAPVYQLWPRIITDVLQMVIEIRPRWEYLNTLAPLTSRTFRSSLALVVGTRLVA
jgi:hypothetical protein